MIWTIPAFLPLSLLQSFFFNNPTSFFSLRFYDSHPWSEYLRFHTSSWCRSCVFQFSFFFLNCCYTVTSTAYFHGIVYFYYFGVFFLLLVFQGPFYILPDNFLFFTIIFSKVFQILPFFQKTCNDFTLFCSWQWLMPTFPFFELPKYDKCFVPGILPCSVYVQCLGLFLPLFNDLAIFKNFLSSVFCFPWKYCITSYPSFNKVLTSHFLVRMTFPVITFQT